MRDEGDSVRRQGFTLLELIVVIALFSVLAGLLLPAIQRIRESANRVRCQNNLKQVGLALHGHQATHDAFPPGGVMSPSSGDVHLIHGHSWWVFLLPYLDQYPLYQGFDHVGDPGTGWLGGDRGNATNRALLDGITLPLLYCPSSTTPPLFELTPGGIFNTTYAGISGATDHPSTISGTSSWNFGRVSFGGVLIPHHGIRLSQISDGISSTMVVGEQSDWCRDASGKRRECRSACQHGFTMGIPNASALWPQTDSDYRTFNLTTVVYGINDKSSTNPNVGGNCGSNSPIQSAHPGGANVLFADGSVHFLTPRVSLQTLYRLANRDDGQVLGDY